MRKPKPTVGEIEASLMQLQTNDDSRGLPTGWNLVFDSPSRVGNYTGDRVKEKRRQRILEDVAQGLGIREICRRHKISHHTLRVLSERFGADVATLRQELGWRWRACASMTLDEINDRLARGENVPPTLGMLAGIATDKSLTLDSLPSMIVETRAVNVDMGWDAFLEQRMGVGAVTISANDGHKSDADLGSMA